MTKLAISLCAFFFAYSESVRFSSLSIYSEELTAGLNDFKSEVKFVINEARMVENEYEKLLKTLHSSAKTLQKEVSDGVNNTVTQFNKDVDSLVYADYSIDVSKCMVLRSAIESKMTDILINTNTCVHNKLNKAKVYIEKSTLSIEYILERLNSLKNIAEDSLSKTIKSQNLMEILQTKMFLESVSSEPGKVAEKILSTLTDTTLVISRIDSLMISDCVSNEAISSLVKETQLVYSKMKTCIADVNSTDAELKAGKELFFYVFFQQLIEKNTIKSSSKFDWTYDSRLR